MTVLSIEARPTIHGTLVGTKDIFQISEKTSQKIRIFSGGQLINDLYEQSESITEWFHPESGPEK